MRLAALLVVLAILILPLFGQTTSSSLRRTQGPYLGQPPPGANPVPFAPGIVSTGMFTRDLAMTPGGAEIYFSVVLGNYAYTTILVARQRGGAWTAPQVMEHMSGPNYMNLEPCVAPDGKRFLFLSNRPDRGEKEGDQDIWAMDRIGDGWGEPYNLGEPVNTEHAEFFPSLTRDGTLYFTRSEKGSRVHHIYRSKLAGGKYSRPEKLPSQVNCGQSQFNAFVDPDERYVIVPVTGRNDSYGGTDYYIVFRNPDDTWSEPVNMGDKINTAGTVEFSPYVSPDGKYFFFMSSRMFPADQWPKPITYQFLQQLHNQPGNGNATMYWMDAGVIDGLRRKK